jgi:hypothetical protein
LKKQIPRCLVFPRKNEAHSLHISHITFWKILTNEVYKTAYDLHFHGGSMGIEKVTIDKVAGEQVRDKIAL